MDLTEGCSEDLDASARRDTLIMDIVDIDEILAFKDISVNVRVGLQRRLSDK